MSEHVIKALRCLIAQQEYPEPMLIEAADIIEALRAENARLKEEYEQALQMCMNQARTLKRWSDMNEKLREALKQIYDAVDFPEDTLRRKIRAARAAIGERDEVSG